MDQHFEHGLGSEDVCHGEETTNGTGQRTAPPLSLAKGRLVVLSGRIAPRMTIKAIQPPFLQLLTF